MNLYSYLFKSYLNTKLKVYIYRLISYIFVGFSFLSLFEQFELLQHTCSYLNPYELVGEPNGPIDHGLQRFEINWLNSFRPKLINIR